MYSGKATIFQSHSPQLSPAAVLRSSSVNLWSKKRVATLIELVMHLLVLFPSQSFDELNQILHFFSFVGVLGNEALVHTDETRHHCRVSLERLVRIISSGHEIALGE